VHVAGFGRRGVVIAAELVGGAETVVRRPAAPPLVRGGPRQAVSGGPGEGPRGPRLDPHQCPAADAERTGRLGFPGSGFSAAAERPGRLGGRGAVTLPPRARQRARMGRPSVPVDGPSRETGRGISAAASATQREGPAPADPKGARGRGWPARPARGGDEPGDQHRRERDITGKPTAGRMLAMTASTRQRPARGPPADEQDEEGTADGERAEPAPPRVA